MYDVKVVLLPLSDSTQILEGISKHVGIGGGGGVFASFLPGIAMALSKLVTTDTTKIGQVILLFEQRLSTSDINVHELSFTCVMNRLFDARL